GIEWGTAVDDRRVYTTNTFGGGTLQPSGLPSHGGIWSALDNATGQIIWQTNRTTNLTDFDSAFGPVSVSDGVVYGGTLSGYMLAFDAATGSVLWSFQSGGAVAGGPAIVDGVVYWGSGYQRFFAGFGQPNNKLYAFSVPGRGDR